MYEMEHPVFLFSGKNKKKVTNLSSVYFDKKMVKVK